jgi:catechol 2,3-dioxygenase-like lactoylglutathione lyase family enzyme
LPTISGVSHISFSVRDVEASAAWWATLLGLTEIDRVSGDTWRGIVMLHPPTRTVLEVQQHHGNTGDVFDPRRTGLDHVGFKVDSYDVLKEWLVRFARLGITHSPIAERDYGAVLTFKDPDGIQFEIFYKSDHP